MKFRASVGEFVDGCMEVLKMTLDDGVEYKGGFYEIFTFFILIFFFSLFFVFFHLFTRFFHAAKSLPGANTIG